MIFGEKNIFAIEVIDDTLQNNKFVNLRLFINSIPIGSIEDSSMIGLVLNSLEQKIEQLTVLNLFIPKLSDKDVFNDVFGGEELLNGVLRISLGDAFDDFLVIAFNAGKGNIRFLWQLIDEPFFKYPEDYPKEILASNVPIESLKSTVGNFKKWFDNL